MKISVIGTGYVGLVVGTCFADSGNEVICMDVDKEKIELLKKGKVPIYEPGLEEMIKINLREDRLGFTIDMRKAVEKSDIIFIAVGTPPDEDGSADLKYVLGVADEIGKYANGDKIVVDKSTVPVGTAEKVKEVIKKRTDYDISVISNPEFLKEGSAITDFMKPDRVIIGSSDEKAIETMRNLYAPFVRTGKPIIAMDEKSAELTKYAANSLLATKISFMNEIANLCDKVGADVELVRKGIGTDSRIGPSFIFPGTGYGGSCFPKDVKALIHKAHEVGTNMKILESVEKVNEHQKTILFSKIKYYYKTGISGKRFAVWGLSFKPKTGDMREAPALEMIKMLIKNNAKVNAYDPEALPEARWRFKDYLDKELKLFDRRYDALNDSDGLIIMTEWNEFKEPDFLYIKELLHNPVIFDGRNIYNPERMKKMGLNYFSIGRPDNI